MELRYYTFKYPDGSLKMHSLKEAYQIKEDFIQERIQEILHNQANKSRVRDGFQAGFNVGLGCEVRTRGHQKEILKEKGLIEVGNATPEEISKCENDRLDRIEQAYDD